MTDKEIKLDDAAKQLFDTFQGLDTSNRGLTPLQALDRLADNLIEEQKKQDFWRIQLFEMAYLISIYLHSDDFLKKADVEKKAFGKLKNIFEKLRKMEDSKDFILIRFRGVPSASDTPENYDYEIKFGNMLLDTGVLPMLIRRQGPKMSNLSDKVLRAFSVFSKYGLNSLYIKIPGNKPEELDQFRICLFILSYYKNAKKYNSLIRFSHDKKQISVPIITDEKKRADPNLTMMTALSGMNNQNIKIMIDTVHGWMQKQKSAESECPYSSVYDAIFGIEKISKQVKKPFLEVNNVKWLTLAGDQQHASTEKAGVARFIVDNTDSPLKIAKILNSVYGDDFHEIDTKRLSDRLRLSSELLTSIERIEKDRKMENEVLTNIDERLDRVKDEVLDDLDVQLVTEPDQKKKPGTVLGKLNKKLDGLVSFYKGRSATRKKMKGMVRNPINFSKKDYKIISRDFKISIEEAKDLVDMLKSCFINEGRFSKGKFVELIPRLTRYEKKIFEFLWHHLKDVIDVKDMVSFLNALQILAVQMDQPKRAFKILVEDFCSEPKKVNFSDNKAIMLTNLIVHEYDKDLTDIEITPEDILLGEMRLNEKVAKYASWRIDKDQEKVFEKVGKIHDKLTESLSADKKADPMITRKHLLSLEREVYIFFSLIACKTGKSVLRCAAYEYGNPETELYRSDKSSSSMSGLMQNLRVLIRGIGRNGGPDDLYCLNEIKRNKEQFLDLVKMDQQKEQVKQIMMRVDEAIDSINFRTPKKEESKPVMPGVPPEFT